MGEGVAVGCGFRVAAVRLWCVLLCAQTRMSVAAPVLGACDGGARARWGVRGGCWLRPPSVGRQSSSCTLVHPFPTRVTCMMISWISCTSAAFEFSSTVLLQPCICFFSQIRCVVMESECKRVPVSRCTEEVALVWVERRWRHHCKPPNLTRPNVPFNTAAKSSRLCQLLLLPDSEALPKSARTAAPQPGWGQTICEVRRSIRQRTTRPVTYTCVTYTQHCSCFVFEWQRDQPS